MDKVDVGLARIRLALLGAVGVASACSSPDPAPRAGDATATATATATASSDKPGSGYVKNALGVIVRLGPPKCDPKLDVAACTGSEKQLACKVDADCKQHRFGSCASHTAVAVGTSNPGRESSCDCAYGCSEDSDCEPGSVCVCGDVLGGPSQCMPARCGQRADCADGPCAVSVYFNGCSTSSVVACKSEKDVCKSDDDCKEDKRGGSTHCVYAEDDRDKGMSWACRGTACQVGRPLMVDGAIHAAPSIARDDWTSAAFSPARLDDGELRLVVAAHWLEIAAMEHASVGSFARFALQLLALGAPADLLAATHRAALDEIEHAKLAYAIASAYGHARLGPARLPAAVAPLETELAAIVRALVIEGCVGETWGAAEASLLAERAEPGPLKHALGRIAHDELEHAALAFRSLCWIVRTFGAAAREAAQSALHDAARALRSSQPPSIVEAGARGARDLSAHGVLAQAEAAELKRRALGSIIRPLFAATLAEGAS